MKAQLNRVHEVLLRMHKALIEWEKRRYEGVHGTVGSPYVLLQLLINDQQFAWLRRMSELIVQIDEVVSAKEGVGEEAGEVLLEQVRRLIGEGSGEGGSFSGIIGRR